jgi:hypothetical protein
MKYIRLAFVYYFFSGLIVFPQSSNQQVSIEKSKPGQVLTLDGRKITVKEIDITPVIENTYSKRGNYDRADNPKLKTIREQEGFDRLISGAKDEFEQQVRILDWSQKRLPKFGSPTSKAWAPLDILKAADEGHTFFCNHYSCIFTGAAASMGWVCRTLALHVGNNPHGSGAPEHSVAEIWSNQYRKWVLFDPLYGMHFKKHGIPLNAWEVRQEWFYGDPEKIDFIFGAPGKVHKASEMPIKLKEHPGFGTLALDKRSIDKLALMGYVPGNAMIDAGSLDYGNMWICTDSLASKVKWHVRIRPEDPATEPYFPVNQADLSFTSKPEGLAVSIRTNTPNFANYRYKIDEGKWIDGEPGIWKLKKGINTLLVKPVNTFGVEGVLSKVVLDVSILK